MKANDMRLKTPVGVLDAALEKEKAAAAFYGELLTATRGIELVRGLVEHLRNEEEKHVRMVEKKMAEIRMK